MKPIPLLFLWGLGLSIIVILCVRFSATSIEQELIQNTQHALTSKALHTITATANGQEITLQGTTSNEAKRQQAIAITKAIDGVSAVNNQITITTPQPTHHNNRHTSSTTQTSNATTLEPETKPTGVYPAKQEKPPFPRSQVNNENHNPLNTLPPINPPPAWQPQNNGMMPFPFAGNYPFPMPMATPWGNHNVMPYPYAPMEFPMPQASLPPVAPMPPIPPTMPVDIWGH